MATNSKTPKQQVAQHDLLDATGNVVDLEESATGFRYTDKGSKLVVEKQVAKMKKASILALAIFGGKTLATNVASAVRQGGGGASEQIKAIEDRFAGIESDPVVWADRTREGATVDYDKLHDAALAFMVESGQAADASAAKCSALRGRMESEPNVVKTMRAVPGIETKYRELVGRTTKTLDDLLAI